ncbi:MAG: hypothetical protein DI565_05675 [Ancylobacter novellus]|uniref:Tyr recombinase domain-containing protein n=1 Tax=Ancylobacter novellus TaxID=921 RepID=A0A2W5KIZ4_ANCNO|nr:MAG: hypothetical protein DI565_05675 [Ancylobacter novellus]
MARDHRDGVRHHAGQTLRARELRKLVCRRDRRGRAPGALRLNWLRKAAARRLAEVGCSTHEIASITGHKSLEEVERYTRAAEQKTFARAAVTRLEEHQVTRRFPNPVPKPDE